MSAEGRAKLWAREKIERLAPKPRPERQPFHGVKSAREILCAPKVPTYDYIPPSARARNRSENPTHAWEMFDSYDEEDSTDTLSETHAVAPGDDSGEGGLT